MVQKKAGKQSAKVNLGAGKPRKYDAVLTIEDATSHLLSVTSGSLNLPYKGLRKTDSILTDTMLNLMNGTSWHFFIVWRNAYSRKGTFVFLSEEVKMEMGEA